MSSVLDQYVSAGVEATYGVAVAPTRAYEVTEDTWTREVEQLTNTGLRAGKHTQLESRRRPIDLGATGSLAGAVTLNGMGFLLDGLLGGRDAPTQIGSTGVYEHNYQTNTDGPDKSYTIQVARVDSEGVTYAYDYSGCVATGFNFAANSGAELTYRIDYAAQGEDINTTATEPVYPAENEMYIYSDVSLLINDVLTNSVTSFSFDGDLAMNVDRRFLRGNARRLQPKRNGEPVFSGTLSAEFQGTEIYDLFKDGTTFSMSITAQTRTAISDDGNNFPSFNITLPAVRFDGSSPVSSTGDLTTIDAPFSVVWDGTNNAVNMTYVTTDSTP